MGTRWRGMLAPVNTPTGDGRRIQTGGFTHRPLPLALKWQRSDTNGHDDSVVIGSLEKIDIGDDAVWGEGELFDDVNPATNPRLAEDVAEAKLLLAKKVIGPSVDPGSAKGMTVLQGQDVPLTDATFEKAWMLNPGDPPQTEVLFTDYEIAAATLVPIPAFAECRPFELLGAAPSALTAAARGALLADRLAMPDLELFDDPKLDRITPLTRRELPNGWTHVFGHIATHDVCHVGIRDTCTTAPYSELDYREFHRYEATDDGTVEFPIAVGRLTAAYGALSDACRCCRGNDDHACDMLSLGAAIAHHDQMDVLAYGRVGEDDDNNAIWFSGIEAPGIDERGVALLNRQKVSGDWRPFAGGLELTEVLVLSHRNPGFPLPRVAMRGGRQSALVAAGTVRPDTPAVRQALRTPTQTDGEMFDYDKLGAAMAQALRTSGLAPVTAAARVRGWRSLPLAADDRPWDADAAKRRLDAWAGDDIAGKYARAFLWSDGDPGLKGSYKLPIADVIDGTLTVVPAGVRAAASYLPKTGGISAQEQARIRGVLDRLLSRIHGKGGGMAYDGSGSDCGPGQHRMPDGTCMDDAEMAYNRNQRRGPDGRWIKGGGLGVPSIGDGGGGGGGGTAAAREKRDDYNQKILNLGLRANSVETDEEEDWDDEEPDNELDSILSDLDDAISSGDNDEADRLADLVDDMIRNDWKVRGLMPDKPAGGQPSRGRAAPTRGLAGPGRQRLTLDRDQREQAADLLNSIGSAEPDEEDQRALFDAADSLRGRADTVDLPNKAADALLYQAQNLDDLINPDEEDPALVKAIEEILRQLGSGMTAAAPEGGHTGAMIALRMTEQDAARLCATDGLPMDELHATFCYLGESDQITPAMRERIVSDMRQFAASQPGPIPADGFALNAFNPGTANNRDTAIVLGVGGQELADAHAMASEVWGGWDGEDGTWTIPEQHSPWVPHVTLRYTDDLNAIKQLADRVGPLSFDRLRVAFGGDVVDFPLGAPNTGGEQIPADEARMSADPQACDSCGKFDACATCTDCGGTPTLSSRAEQALMSLRLAEANLLLTK